MIQLLVGLFYVCVFVCVCLFVELCIAFFVCVFHCNSFCEYVFHPVLQSCWNHRRGIAEVISNEPGHNIGGRRSQGTGSHVLRLSTLRCCSWSLPHSDFTLLGLFEAFCVGFPVFEATTWLQPAALFRKDVYWKVDWIDSPLKNDYRATGTQLCTKCHAACSTPTGARVRAAVSSRKFKTHTSKSPRCIAFLTSKCPFQVPSSKELGPFFPD